MKRRLSTAIVIAGVWICGESAVFGPLSRIEAGNFSSAVEAIHTKELRRHCEVLASDTFEGRETGSRGGHAAGAYIVDALRRHKLAPAGVDGDYYQTFPPDSRNILAVIPGSDRLLRNEYVVVGAHYDHVGYGSARNSRGPVGYIHNGADDNASGTAALLEMVNSLASLDTPPKRSVLLVFWDGEEKGLLGSEYWVQYPTVPLDRIRLVFNIDMIGRLRDNRAEVFGARSAGGLRRLLSAQNVAHPVALNFTWETRRDSDHYSFFSRRIPYLMIFTGKHPEYHTPYDDVDKLNVEGIAKIAQLLFRAVYAAADAPALPAFRVMAMHEGAQAQRDAEAPLPLPASRLGVAWDERLGGRNIVQLAEIDSGSAAESAGLLVGDRVLELDGIRIGGPEDFRDAVLAAPARTTIVIERPGDKESRTRPLRLGGSPDPLGLSWHIDDAEPGTAIVNRVIGGSPAARAGFRMNDRLLSVSGSAFSSAHELAGLLERQKGALSVQLEREGQIKTVRIILRAATRRPQARPKSPGLTAPPQRALDVSGQSVPPIQIPGRRLILSKWHNRHRRYCCYDCCRWHRRQVRARAEERTLLRETSSAPRNVSMVGRLAIGIAMALCFLWEGSASAQGLAPNGAPQGPAANPYYAAPPSAASQYPAPVYANLPSGPAAYGTPPGGQPGYGMNPGCPDPSGACGPGGGCNPYGDHMATTFDNGTNGVEVDLERSRFEALVCKVVRNSWFRFNYMHWDIQAPKTVVVGAPLDPVTTSITNPTQFFLLPDFSGFARDYDTSPIRFDGINGIEGTMGVPLTYGTFELSAFILEQASDVVDPRGLPQSNQLFALFGAVTLLVNGHKDAALLTFSDRLEDRFISQVWGGEANIVFDALVPKERGLICRPLVGYRYMAIQEQFRVEGTNPGVPLTIIQSRTFNNVHGPQFGGQFEFVHPWFTLGAEPKIAFAVNQNVADVFSTDPTIGDHSDSLKNVTFSPIGQLDAYLRVPIHDHIRFYAAYNLVGVGAIARPQEQIVYDVNQVGLGPQTNNIHLDQHRHGFMMQGYSIGAEVNF